MKSLSRTRVIGGSLVVTIPVGIVKSEGLKEGEFVEVEVKRPRKDFFGALKGVGPFMKEDKMKGQLEE